MDEIKENHNNFLLEHDMCKIKANFRCPPISSLKYFMSTTIPTPASK